VHRTLLDNPEEIKMTEKKQTSEKEWSDIRNEILKKVEVFTDHQIEKLKASIHTMTEPKAKEESEHSAKGVTEEEKKAHTEGKGSHKRSA
jgi:hypothetical protein